MSSKYITKIVLSEDKPSAEKSNNMARQRVKLDLETEVLAYNISLKAIRVRLMTPKSKDERIQLKKAKRESKGFKFTKKQVLN